MMRPYLLPLIMALITAQIAGSAQAETANVVARLAQMKPVEDQDTRLKTIDYDETAVVRLDGCMSFQTMITFGKNEKIENVGVGDSSQWQVMPNKRANLLFVKPLSTKAFSNMTVVSDKHSYNFELRSASESDCTHGRVVYALRFAYAPDPASAPQPGKAAVPTDLNALPLPEKRNTAYTYSGDMNLVPLRVFDDGASTYMKWADGAATPAVYALNADNTESLINFANRGDYFVIEQVARAFVLRSGSQKVILYNDAYKVQALDAQSPKPHHSGGR